MSRKVLMRYVGIIASLSLLILIIELIPSRKQEDVHSEVNEVDNLYVNSYNDPLIEKDIETLINETVYKFEQEQKLAKEENISGEEGRVFYETLLSVYENYDARIGDEIEVIGFVYKDEEEFEENQFVVAWNFIDCCEDDKQISGFLCESTDIKHYENNQWVCIKGIIETTSYYDEDYEREIYTPIVKIKSITPVDEPLIPYIYL